ncbi:MULTISPECIES: ABC transporter permease [Pseudonocardia]|nr:MULTISPECIES: iron ABC transporter permease [Pseudonocardia]
MLPLILVCGFLFAVPIGMLVIGAFRNAPPGLPAQWSLEAFRTTYTDPASYSTLQNSILLAGGGTLLSTVVALLLAFLVTRTNTPLRGVVTAAMVLVVALPPLFYAISWGMLGNATTGLLNTTWRSLAGTDGVLFDANSWAGLLLVSTVKGAAFSYLLLLGPFRAIDRSLEEAAQVSGAGRLRTLLGIDLVVLAPAITGVVILSFVIGLESFDVPLFLGTPAGIDVFSTQIYGQITNMTPANYGGASALSLLLVVVVMALVAIQWKVLGRRNYTTVSGKSYRTEVWNIGPWRWAGTAFIAVYLLLAILLPLLQLVLGSLQPFFGGTVYSLTNYEQLLSDPSTVTALRTTLLVALVGGLIAMALALLVVYAIAHNESRWRRVLDLLTWLPWAVPGVVLGLGMAWMYVSIPGLRNLYGSVVVVMTGLVVTAIPIATRAVQPAVGQITRELEEASRVSGASPLRMFAGIVLPLIMPSFLAGWFVVAIVISGNLAIPILLSSAQNPTVPLLVYELYTQGQASRAAALFTIVLAALLVGLVVMGGGARLLRRRFGPAPTAATAPPDDPAHPPPPGGGAPDPHDVAAGIPGTTHTEGPRR